MQRRAQKIDIQLSYHHLPPDKKKKKSIAKTPEALLLHPPNLLAPPCSSEGTSILTSNSSVQYCLFLNFVCNDMACIVCVCPPSLNITYVEFSCGHPFLSVYSVTLRSCIMWCMQLSACVLHSCVHPTFDRHLGSFQFGAITNNASLRFSSLSLSAHVHVFLLVLNLGVELLGHRVYI